MGCPWCPPIVRRRIPREYPSDCADPGVAPVPTSDVVGYDGCCFDRRRRAMADPTRSMSPAGKPTAEPPAAAATGTLDDVTAGPDGAARAESLESLPPTAAGRYEFLELLARGGMGVIYRAVDTVLGREVAIKVLQERFPVDSGAAHRFVDEARIAAQLQHPGIPAIHDLGTLPDGRPFLAMKLIKGRTLEEYLKDRGPDSPNFVAVFEQVCQAVGYAHDHKVIHRDLKPANVMV